MLLAFFTLDPSPLTRANSFIVVVGMTKSIITASCNLSWQYRDKSELIIKANSLENRCQSLINYSAIQKKRYQEIE